MQRWKTRDALGQRFRQEEAAVEQAKMSRRGEFLLCCEKAI